MSLVPEIQEAARRLVDVLEAMKLRYAVGGAVAMAFGGYVRGTRDIDMLILLPAVRSQEFADSLNQAGFVMRDEKEKVIPVEVGRMLESTRDLGQFPIWWKDVKVEIFTPKVPLQDSILVRRTRIQVGDFSMWVTTVEDLILLKMIFHRPKDLEDVRRLLAANRSSLDAAYIASWMPRTLEVAAAEELKGLMKQAGISV